MSADFTSRKLTWLEAVARDRALPRSSIALAVLLACRYFNGETHDAWPAQRTLAGVTGMTPANVHIGIERLVAAGLLHRRSGGPRTTSRYSIPKRWKASERYCLKEHSGIAGNSAGGIAGNSAAPLSAIAEPGKEPETISRERTPRRERRRSDQADALVKEVRTAPRGKRSHAGRRGRATLLPRDWACGAAELAAAKEIVAWEPDRARREFEKFSAWHSDRSTSHVNWAAAWRNWCSKGLEIDRREQSRPRHARRRPDGLLGGRWYERQKRAAHAAQYDIGEEDAAS